MSAAPLPLKDAAEALGGALPALLAGADRLATAVMFGAHGRRRAGLGDEFWQYRSAHPGDPARIIDWRRSARSDLTFVREREWQAAQTVTFWVDAGRSMAFSGDSRRAPKSDRARLIALSLMILLLRGGERVGLAGGDPPRSGRSRVAALAARLLAETAEGDHAAPVAGDLARHGRGVFVSDFLGDLSGLERAMAEAADKGVRGLLLQVLDPAEEEFPFDGRTVFESMSGAVRHETLKAGELRQRYLDRLAARKDRLSGLARAIGWHYHAHHTGEPALPPLVWAYAALEGGR